MQETDTVLMPTYCCNNFGTGKDPAEYYPKNHAACEVLNDRTVHTHQYRSNAGSGQSVTSRPEIINPSRLGGINYILSDNTCMNSLLVGQAMFPARSGGKYNDQVLAFFRLQASAIADLMSRSAHQELPRSQRSAISGYNAFIC